MTWHATVLTIFPEMLPGPLAHSLAGKALSAGLWQLETVDILTDRIDQNLQILADEGILFVVDAGDKSTLGNPLCLCAAVAEFRLEIDDLLIQAADPRGSRRFRTESRVDFEQRLRILIALQHPAR